MVATHTGKMIIRRRKSEYVSQFNLWSLDFLNSPLQGLGINEIYRDHASPWIYAGKCYLLYKADNVLFSEKTGNHFQTL